MAEYLIQDTTLTGIADAIRAKTGKTDTMTAADMAAEIAGIEAGSGSGTAQYETCELKLGNPFDSAVSIYFVNNDGELDSDILLSFGDDGIGNFTVPKNALLHLRLELNGQQVDAQRYWTISDSVGIHRTFEGTGLDILFFLTGDGELSFAKYEEESDM